MPKFKIFKSLTIALIILYLNVNECLAVNILNCESDEVCQHNSDFLHLNRALDYELFLRNDFSNFNVSSDYVDLIKNGQSLGFDFAKEWDNIFAATKPKAMDPKCLRDLGAIVAGIATGELSSFKLFDSWGKIPAGLLRGHTKEFGNFDECVNLKRVLPDESHILGKYCLAKLPVGKLVTSSPLGNLLTINLGVCMPASCSAAQFDVFYKTVIKTILGLSIGAETTLVAENTCAVSEKPTLKGWDWVAVVVLTILTFGIVFSSLYEYFTKLAGKKPNPTLKSFSLLTNMKQLLLVTPNVKSPNVIPCLNGIRCLSLLWIFMGHVLGLFLSQPHINPVEILSWGKSGFGMVMQGAPFAVDTFFFLTGFLVAFIALKDMDRNNGKLNIPMMYLHRIIRILPMVALATLIYGTLYTHMGSGPQWWTAKTYNMECIDNWWSTLLFVQNYATPNHMCIGHTWYLAVDMQLYLFAPFLLIILWKWQRKGVAAIALIGLLFVVCLFTNIMVNDYNYHNRGILSPGGRVFAKTYFVTHARTSPFIVGILFGYYMHKSKGSRVKLPKLAVLVGWISAFAIIGAILFGLQPHAKSGENTSTLEEAFFWSLGRVAWPLAVSWIVFACVNDYAGPINHFLSAPIWQPFAKLSYCIYLWHILLTEVNVGSLRVNTNFSNYDLTLQFWGVMGWSLLLSTYMHLAFEAPLLNLANIFIPKPNRKPIAVTSAVAPKEKIIEPTTATVAGESQQEITNEVKIDLNSAKDADEIKTSQNES